MRFLATILFALVLSGLAGGMAAVAIADWVRGDEAFILVFMAIGPVAIVSVIAFLIAGTRPEPAAAIDRCGRWLVAILSLLLFAFSFIEVVTASTTGPAFRGVQLMFAMFASCLAVVVVQWVVFRFGRGRTSAPSGPRFGRQPQP